jgi:hypothetical protein
MKTNLTDITQQNLTILRKIILQTKNNDINILNNAKDVQSEMSNSLQMLNYDEKDMH